MICRQEDQAAPLDVLPVGGQSVSQPPPHFRDVAFSNGVEQCRDDSVAPGFVMDVVMHRVGPDETNQGSPAVDPSQRPPAPFETSASIEFHPVECS
jgi:hypothetical protein